MHVDNANLTDRGRTIIESRTRCTIMARDIAEDCISDEATRIREPGSEGQNIYLRTRAILTLPERIREP